MSREAIFEASLGYFLTPVKKHLDDPSVTEIMVNGFDEVYIERRGKLEHTDSRFPSEDALLTAVHNVAQYVGREIDDKRKVGGHLGQWSGDEHLSPQRHNRNVQAEHFAHVSRVGSGGIHHQVRRDVPGGRLDRCYPMVHGAQGGDLDVGEQASSQSPCRAHVPVDHAAGIAQAVASEEGTGEHVGQLEQR